MTRKTSTFAGSAEPNFPHFPSTRHTRSGFIGNMAKKEDLEKIWEDRKVKNPVKKAKWTEETVKSWGR